VAVSAVVSQNAVRVPSFVVYVFPCVRWASMQERLVDAGVVGWLARVVIAASHVTAVGAMATNLWGFPSAITTARLADSGKYASG
jgi:hypothetical protein